MEVSQVQEQDCKQHAFLIILKEKNILPYYQTTKKQIKFIVSKSHFATYLSKSPNSKNQNPLTQKGNLTGDPKNLFMRSIQNRMPSELLCV